MTLPSNVPHMFGNSENTTSSYVTHLPKTINLTPLNSWEVALVEFLYPVTWYNLDDKEITVIKFTERERSNPAVLNEVDKAKRRDNYLRKLRTKKILGVDYSEVFKDGYNYNTHVFNLGRTRISNKEEFVEYVSEKLRFKGLDTRLMYNANKHQECQMHMQANQELEMHPMLARMLGFDKHIFNTYSEAKRFKSKYEVDPNGGFEFIYIYCDVVEPSMVGNVLAPLLRAVIAQKTWGERISHVFEQPHYIPLALSEIQKINIRILQDTGDPVKFERGKVLVKLHFRLKNK